MLGEPGILYIVFVACIGNLGSVYLQRVDLEDGHNFFPTYNVSGQYGAPISPPSSDLTPGITSFYNYPYIYTVYVINTDPDDHYFFYALKTDSLANSLWGDSGIFMSEVGPHSIPYRQAVPDGFGGLTNVFTHETGGNLCDVYAKHVNADGTLGGPLPQVQNTIITLNGNNVVLTWNSIGDSVQYRIYKSAQPYVFPTEPDTIVSDTTYIDVNALNEGVRFYNVRWEP